MSAPNATRRTGFQPRAATGFQPRSSQDEASLLRARLAELEEMEDLRRRLAALETASVKAPASHQPHRTPHRIPHPTRSCRDAPPQERSEAPKVWDRNRSAQQLARWMRYPTVPLEYMEEHFQLPSFADQDLRTFLVDQSIYFTINKEDRVSLTPAGEALKGTSSPSHTPPRGSRVADFSPVEAAAEASPSPSHPPRTPQRGPHRKADAGRKAGPSSEAAAEASAPPTPITNPDEYLQTLVEHYRSKNKELLYAVASNKTILASHPRLAVSEVPGGKRLSLYLQKNRETFSGLVDNIPELKAVAPAPKAAAAAAGSEEEA